MSKFKDFPQFIVELGSSVLDWKNELLNHLTTRLGWQKVADGDDPAYFIVKPPASESFGNAVGYEVVRFDFTGTQTSIKLGIIGTKPTYSAFQLGFPSYNYESAISINGVRITTGAIDYYMLPKPRAQAFYNALTKYQQDNPDSDIAKFSVTLNTVDGTDNVGDVFINQVPGAVVPVFGSSANIPVSQTSGTYIPGDIAQYSESFSVTHDLASGFVYYLSVHNRKIELATKTTAAFYGPMGVQYAPNAAAVAATPDGLTPIEAVLYATNGTDYRGNHAVRFSHVWGIVSGDSWGQFSGRQSGIYDRTGYLPSKPLRDLKVTDNMGRSEASGLGLSPGTVNDAMPNGVNMVALATRPRVDYDQSPNSGATFFTPGLPLEDVFCMLKGATDESLHLARIVTDSSPLVSLTDAGAELQSAAKFPDAGAFIVGAEIVRYSGKAGNTLTGLTRASYGTAQVAHMAGESVYAAMWFVKINGGAMTAGPVKPGEVS